MKENIVIKSINSEIKRKLEAQAKDRGLSLNKYLKQILEQYTSGIDFKFMENRYSTLVEKIIEFTKEVSEEQRELIVRSTSVIEVAIDELRKSNIRGKDKI